MEKTIQNQKAQSSTEYECIVEQLAEQIQPEELDKLETKDLQALLGAGFESWKFEDWYKLLTDIKRKKRQAEHEAMTAEAIFNGLPWAAQQAAQEAVGILIKKAEADKLFKADETADAMVNVLWNMFYCMGINIKNTARKLGKDNKAYSYNDLNENKLLLDFIKELRDEQWYGQGEVARLRCKE